MEVPLPKSSMLIHSWLPISNWKNEGNMCGILPEVFFNTNSCNVSQQCNFNIAFVIICETMFSLWSHLKYHRKILAVGRGGACPSIRPMKRVCRCDDRSIPVYILWIYFYYSVLNVWVCLSLIHDDVIKSKLFPLYWPFVRGIHRSSANSTHKGQWRGALIFFFDLCLE